MIGREVGESCEGGGGWGRCKKHIKHMLLFFFLSTAAFKGIFLLTRSLKKNRMVKY